MLPESHTTSGYELPQVTPEEYRERYYREILNPLDPQTVLKDLVALAECKIPTLLCWEKSNASSRDWWHRGFVAGWLANSLDVDVREAGLEHEGCAGITRRSRHRFADEASERIRTEHRQTSASGQLRTPLIDSAVSTNSATVWLLGRLRHSQIGTFPIEPPPSTKSVCPVM